jgi:hypothetical protein
MNGADFRRIVLSFEDVEESSHLGAPAFRVRGGRIFASLASEGEGYGSLMLTPDQQRHFTSGVPG